MPHSPRQRTCRAGHLDADHHVAVVPATAPLSPDALGYPDQQQHRLGEGGMSEHSAVGPASSAAARTIWQPRARWPAPNAALRGPGARTTGARTARPVLAHHAPGVDRRRPRARSTIYPRLRPHASRPDMLPSCPLVSPSGSISTRESWPARWRSSCRRHLEPPASSVRDGHSSLRRRFSAGARRHCPPLPRRDVLAAMPAAHRKAGPAASCIRATEPPAVPVSQRDRPEPLDQESPVRCRHGPLLSRASTLRW